MPHTGNLACSEGAVTPYGQPLRNRGRRVVQGRLRGSCESPSRSTRRSVTTTSCSIRATCRRHPLPKQFACSASRHYGVGSDGILYGPIPDPAGFGLRIFNPDGSEAEKSGNGIRIFARYLRDSGRVSGSEESSSLPVATFVSAISIRVRAESKSRWAPSPSRGSTRRCE